MNTLLTSLNHLFSKKYLLYYILCLSGSNLLFMHIYILHICNLESETNISIWADNLFSICFDLCILFIICLILSLRNIKVAMWLVFVITWLWSLSNVLYSRFFYHYISLSAVEQVDVLSESIIYRCIWDSLRFADFYYPIVAVLFIIIITKCDQSTPRKFFQKIILITCIALIVDISTHAAYCIFNPQYRYMSFLKHRLYLQHLASARGWSQQNLVHFIRGEIRTMCENIMVEIQGTINLSDKQIKAIQAESLKAQNSISIHEKIVPKNVIFIIIESYMSFTSDMIVDGKEVTPFLNSLKHQPTTYYNGKMRENVTIGESSDGQFIYMTGILPLQSDVTVSKVRRRTLPGLPKILGKESRMIIPTTTSVWNQDEMCRQYGFNYLYTRDDYRNNYGEDLNDKQVFELAIQKDKSSKSPFLSVILTMSMHGPYTDQIDKSFHISNPSLPRDLVSYLNACHYTDQQIKQYFDHLRTTELFNNSLIIISADHHVHKADFGEVDNHIPLYIIDANGIPKGMWQEECNQLDVYTTLLDIMDCKSSWYGLGRSLISPNYYNAPSTQTWNVSQWIIMGDYFSKH